MKCVMLYIKKVQYGIVKKYLISTQDKIYYLVENSKIKKKF